VREKRKLDASSKENAGRSLLFSLWIVFSITLFSSHLLALVRFALDNDNASHIVLIPFVSAWLMYLERKRIFTRLSTDFPVGIFLSLAGAALFTWTFRSSPASNMDDRFTGLALTLVILWIAGFALLFGRAALLAGRFALLFLFLTVPLPGFLLNPTIFSLQKGSATLTALLFDVLGVPYLRDGFVFRLAHVTIEVARECSGIRSSMALFILALLAGHLLLRTSWTKAALIACGIVVMIVKNAIRIVTLTLLASYVDPGFLFGRLHHEGGVVFFLLGLLLLAPVLYLLQRWENLTHTPAAHLPSE
jgi:exosortase